MISVKEKKQLIYKIFIIMFSSLALLSFIRVLLFHYDSMHNYEIYILVIKELFFSILSAGFIIAILYFFIKKEVLRVNEKAMNYAFTDALTGLYNRHYLNDFIKNFTSMNKEDASFAIIFIDIDRFKDVNDTLGHSTGDCILKNLALSLQSLIRPSDILCRYGGEEFVIIFTDIFKENALKKVELIRSSIENRTFDCKEQKITISAGISFGNSNDNIHKVIEESDKALYMAKEAGRNCVRVFTQQYEN
ncbi:GGDEF domain-containing protein [Sulfurimonas sp.]|uniref:GGDEF domain-containing protein n=1 Tax=Sulfurimonas sp. TaxID=2022749 RepID=UPI003563640B